MKKILISMLVAALFLFGCAGQSEVVKPSSAKTFPSQIKTTVRNVRHFVEFRSEPLGADVFVIDSKTGAEAQTFGKTPVRILLVTKKIEVDVSNGKIVNVSDVVVNTVGLTYGTVMVKGVEFQFKFRMKGYYDEIKIEKIPIFSYDSEAGINVVMTPIPVKK